MHPTRIALLWSLATLGLGAWLAFTMTSPGADRRVFQPGPATGGHHQIEIACERCHAPFGVRQEACLDGHAAELEAAVDSHAARLFDDPRNAADLERIDVRQCITCHTEHRPELTGPMGVTLPADFCFPCHDTVAEDRLTHRGLPADTCASAGCHHYHDNRTHHADFLVEHGESPRETFAGTLPPRETWVRKDHPPLAACAACHEREPEGFLGGRHGMRLAAGLGPMSPALARLPMRADAHDRTLRCGTCHDAHSVDVRRAAVDGCLSCHADEHSTAYTASPHGRLWARELSGEGSADSGVSCASCHLPREPRRMAGRERIVVEHNQTPNLRPNEKMLREVCLRCHSLRLSIDALADPQLIRRNFAGRPARHVESIDMALSRRE